MNKNMEVVYIAYINVDYEGAYMDSLKIFRNKSDALEYLETLKKDNKAEDDYFYELEERKLN